MSLDDLDPPTLRLVARCIEWKRVHGWLWVATVCQLSCFEPGSDTATALRFLGIDL